MQARNVAFAGIVATQLAQTLTAGWAVGGVSLSVFSAVGGSVAVLVTALTVAPLNTFLGLATPGLGTWLLIGGSSLAAGLLNLAFPIVSFALPKPSQFPTLASGAPAA